MEHPNEFRKLLRQIMSQECKPLMSDEEIHFDQLAMEVMQLVGERWVFIGYCAKGKEYSNCILSSL